jgi:toxin ParE1/3/4
MEGQKRHPVRLSIEFIRDLDDIFQYSVETFGRIQAKKYEADILNLVESLYLSWNMFAECRHLRTKSRIYRWIILESHCIIYRVTSREIQVLRILHSKLSIRSIRASRRIKLK